MRTWGRTYNKSGGYTWTEVTTDANGYNDLVYLVTLCQVLQLNLGESPFYSNYGIPAYQSVIQQIFPDLYVSIVQQQFAPFFASIIISRQNSPTPTYLVNVITSQGYKLQATVPIPT